MGRLPHTTLAKMEFHLQLPPPSVEFHSSNMLREMLTFHHFPKIYASKKTVTKPLKKNETTFPLDSSVNLRMGLPAEEVQLHPQKTEEWVKVSELRCAAEAAAGLLGLPPEGAVSAPLAGAGPASKMAPSTLLRPFSRLLTPAGLPSGSSARSKFYVRDPPDDNKANWLKVGLTLGTTVFLWFYLIKEHHEDVLEYKRRNGLE